VRHRSRLLGALAVAGTVAAIVAWVMASLTQPGYRSARDDLSALAAGGADHPWITMTGELALGLGIIALAAGLAAELAGLEVTVGACVLVVAGVAAAIQALAREDCLAQRASCTARVHAGHVSWHHTLHEMTSGLAFLAILAAPLVFAPAFRRDGRWRSLATYSLVTTALGFALLIAYVATAETAFGGLGQRVFLFVPLAWIVVTGTRLARPRAVGPPSRLP
jgi:hypothetical protein